MNLTFALHHRSLMGFALTLALCCLGLPADGAAAAPAAQEERLPNYRQTTDKELTALAARWDHLSAAERRALFSEVKLRMVQRKSVRPGAPSGVLHIRLTRRFGTGPNNPAKGQLHIQMQAPNQVARVRTHCQGPPDSCPNVRGPDAATPVADEQQQKQQEEQQKYGVGFERRTGQQPAVKGKQAPREPTVRAVDSG